MSFLNENGLRRLWTNITAKLASKTHAEFGFDTQAGSKGFLIKNIASNDLATTGYVTLELDDTDGLSSGDIYTMDLTYNNGSTKLFSEQGTIVYVFEEIGGVNNDDIRKYVTVTNFPAEVTSIDTLESLGDYYDYGDNLFRVAAKPNVGTRTIGLTALAAGSGSRAAANGSTAFGLRNVADGPNSFAAGVDNNPQAYSSITLGKKNVTTGYGVSTAIGNNNTVSGENATAIGYKNTVANTGGVAMGEQNKSEGTRAVALGYKCEAIGNASIALGSKSISKGAGSLVAGTNSTVESSNGFSAGTTNAISKNATAAAAVGANLKADTKYSLVTGKFNTQDTTQKYARIVGNGESDSDRSNAYTLDWQGNGWFSGNVTLGGNTLTIGSTSITETQLQNLLKYFDENLYNELIQYPYSTSNVKIETYGSIAGTTEGIIKIDTQDCEYTGTYEYTLCTLTLPKGTYKLSSTEYRPWYANSPNRDILTLRGTTPGNTTFCQCNGFEGSCTFTLTEQKEITFAYQFEMTEQGYVYEVIPSLTRIA